jgi:hypothetical protein
MKESLFVKYTSWLSAIILGVVTKINGGKTELSYLHKSMLTEELSIDLGPLLTIKYNCSCE